MNLAEIDEFFFLSCAIVKQCHERKREWVWKLYIRDEEERRKRRKKKLWKIVSIERFTELRQWVGRFWLKCIRREKKTTTTRWCDLLYCPIILIITNILIFIWVKHIFFFSQSSILIRVKVGDCDSLIVWHEKLAKSESWWVNYRSLSLATQRHPLKCCCCLKIWILDQGENEFSKDLVSLHLIRCRVESWVDIFHDLWIWDEIMRSWVDSMHLKNWKKIWNLNWDVWCFMAIIIRSLPRQCELKLNVFFLLAIVYYSQLSWYHWEFCCSSTNRIVEKTKQMQFQTSICKIIL